LLVNLWNRGGINPDVRIRRTRLSLSSSPLSLRQQNDGALTRVPPRSAIQPQPGSKTRDNA
jgi:hypothetical protein